VLGSWGNPSLGSETRDHPQAASATGWTEPQDERFRTGGGGGHVLGRPRGESGSGRDGQELATARELSLTGK
jgi:hypothetical protein